MAFKGLPVCCLGSRDLPNLTFAVYLGFVLLDSLKVGSWTRKFWARVLGFRVVLVGRLFCARKS